MIEVGSGLRYFRSLPCPNITACSIGELCSSSGSSSSCEYLSVGALRCESVPAHMSRATAFSRLSHTASLSASESE